MIFAHLVTFGLGKITKVIFQQFYKYHMRPSSFPAQIEILKALEFVCLIDSIRINRKQSQALVV